ncbi:MAG: hypothetical protein O7D33_04965, partial [Chloroflexi bacterium]|nr:hypothetical protein [Chloroflexota bacterium]
LTVQSQAGGGGAALVPFRDPSAKFSRNILIPEDFTSLTFQTEPSLAIDPKDPDHLLVGLIDYNFTDMVSYTSIDGGSTWEGPHHAKYPRKDLAVAGDPIVAFDREGNAYYAFISLNVQEFTVGPILGQAVVSAISMNSSTDGGFTWENPVQAAGGGVITTALPPDADLRPRGRIEIGFLDKPWMTVGPHPTDPDKDVIYVIYTKFIDISEIFWIDELPFLGAPALETVIELVKSEDGGLNWSDPIEVSPRAQYTILLNPITQEGPSQATAVRQVVQGSSLTVANDGTLYVGWMDTTDDDSFEGLAEIYVRRSDDAGETFGPAQRVSGFLEPGFQARNAPFRSWASAFPKLAAGLDDDVYVMWVAIPNDDPEDDGDVFIVGSTDRGETWSRRKKVNDDDTDHFQFFPELTVDPSGTLHAMWGDLRDDPNEVSYHIYYASSEDGGDTWSVNSRVTDFPSNPNRAFPGGRFIGDYFGIEATDDDVYMVWADSRLGEFGPANQKIGFARQRLMPSPSIFISPPSGPAGQDIIVQGFNFQAHRDVFIEVAGVVVSTTRTQDEGRFTTQIFVPISGEGPHTVRAFDSSGNVAGSSYFMDFGFDSIEQVVDLIAELSEKIDALSASGVPSSGQNSVPQGMLDELQQLRTTVEELKAQVSATGQSTPDENDRSSVLLFALLGGGVILILGTGGLLAALIRRGTR